MAWNRLSISKKLPLGISLLLLVVLGGMTAAAYIEVRRAALDAADDRLGRLTGQVVELLVPQIRTRLVTAREMASLPAIRDYLQVPSPASRSVAVDTLTAFQRRTAQVSTVELWDTTGGRVLTVGESLPPLPDADRSGLIARLRTDTLGAAIGPLRQRPDSALAQSTIALVSGPNGRLLGFFVDRRGVSPAQAGLAAATLVAARPAVRAYFASPTPVATAEVRDTLNEFMKRAPQVTTVELWDAKGARALVVGEDAPALPDSATQAALARLVADTPRSVVSGYRTRPDTAATQFTVLRIGPANAVLGYVVDRYGRPFAPNAGNNALRALIGSNASILIGNVDDEVWTDLQRIVPGPPRSARADTQAVRYERAGVGRVVAAVRPIAQTPWLFTVEFPEEAVLGRTHQFLLIAIALSLALAAAGGFTGWVMSRRITVPLQQLTEGAEAITAGRLSLRVNLERSDELGRLARSFNTMAGEVEVSHRHLETLVDRYRLLFDQNPLPMWLYDRKTRAFLDANAAATERYGYSRNEFLSMTVDSLMNPREQRRLMPGPDGPVADNGQVTQHRLKDGSTIDVEMTRHDIELDGRPVSLALADDVTARLAAERARQEGEEAVRRLNVELERRVEERTSALEASNRELEAFSYSVSHDLRAPLRAIAGFSRILLEDHAESLPTEAQDYLNVITRNSKQMGQLIDDLLMFSRLGRQQISQTAVDMTGLAKSIGEEALQANTGRNVEFVVEDLPPAHGERALIRQVFENLIQNAIKFTRTREPARIEVGFKRGDGEDIYYVRDNGVGFDMRYVDKLFGVFQRLHRAEEFEGTGVGLAIVQRIVNRHGGRVWAESAPDQGATFYFSMPGEKTA